MSLDVAAARQLHDEVVALVDGMSPNDWEWGTIGDNHAGAYSFVREKVGDEQPARGILGGMILDEWERRHGPSEVMAGPRCGNAVADHLDRFGVEQLAFNDGEVA